MKTTPPMNRVRTLAAVLGVPALLACSDLLGSGPLQEPPVVLSPGIHPVLVIDGAQAGTARVELHLQRVEVEEEIASFQGELRYDHETLSLKGVTIADGITGASNEVEKGVIRFAGVALAGIPETAVLTLSFDSRSVPDADRFEVLLEEVTASEEFRDLTPRVVQESRSPVASEAPTAGRPAAGSPGRHGSPIS